MTWAQKIRKNGIRVFTKPHPLSQFDYFRAVSIFPHSYDLLSQTLFDVPNWHHWLPKLHKARVLTAEEIQNHFSLTPAHLANSSEHAFKIKNTNTGINNQQKSTKRLLTESVVYAVHRARPLKDRDYYLHLTPPHMDAQGTALTSWQFAKGPHTEGHLRVDSGRIQVLFSKINANGHRVDISGHFDPMGKLNPQWFNRRLPFLVYRTMRKANMYLLKQLHTASAHT